MTAARRYLREVERRQRREESALKRRKLGGTSVVEALPVPDALSHPSLGPHVLRALAVAFTIAFHPEEDTPRGTECFCCGARWRPDNPPVLAVLGTSGEGGIVGLACDRCCADGRAAFAERLMRALGEVFEMTDLRVFTPGPAGRA
jgi:hypothetical protein